MFFELVGDIEEIELIAVGKSIRDIKRLRKQFGPGRWRKPKGVGRVRLFDGRIRTAEIHWYEATGLGRFEFKIKCFVDSL